MGPASRNQLPFSKVLSSWSAGPPVTVVSKVHGAMPCSRTAATYFDIHWAFCIYAICLLVGTTVEQYQQRYQLTVATVTGRLAGTPFDQWQFNGDTTSTGDLNVTLSLLAANPGIVVYRLTKATELGAALSGACSTEYCLRLAATRVPADLASINVAPDINKILDKINTVQAQEAQQKRQQYIGTVVGAVVGSVVGVALLAFITYRLYSQMKARQAAELAAAKLEAEEKAKKQQEEFALWASQVLGPNPQAAVAATGVRPGFMTPMYPLTALPTRSNTMFRSQAVTPSLVPNAEQLQVDAAELNQALTQYYAAMQHVQMLLTPKVTPKATPLQTPKVQSPRHSRSNSSSALPPAKDLPTSPHPHDLI